MSNKYILKLFLFMTVSFTIFMLQGTYAEHTFQPRPDLAKFLDEGNAQHPLPLYTLSTTREEASTELANSVIDTLQQVLSGSFMMGPNPDKVPDMVSPNNQPQHKVTLSSYYMSRYLVTFEQYDLYTRLIQGPWIQPISLRFHSSDRQPKFPVQGVNWYQANSFCAYLKKLTGLPFDLPTEAQWEYAARSGGKDVEWGTNDGTAKGNVNTGDGPDDYNTLIPYQHNIDEFPPNPMGFYAMGLTVTEWMKDWEHGYASDAETNPQGPPAGKEKTIRGGSILSSLGLNGVYYRASLPPAKGDGTDGFRCVINSSLPLTQLKAQAAKQLNLLQ